MLKERIEHDRLGMKTVRIFSDRIQDRIRLERFRFVCIRVRMFNIRHRIRIRILKSYIYNVDIQSYLIRHDWHYPYSNPNPTRNIKTNMISVISLRIRSVFIPTLDPGNYTVAHGTASIASRPTATVHAWQCHSPFDETEHAYALVRAHIWI